MAHDGISFAVFGDFALHLRRTPVAIHVGRPNIGISDPERAVLLASRAAEG